MGLMLDSSVLIAAERGQFNIDGFLEGEFGRVDGLRLADTRRYARSDLASGRRPL